MTWSFAGLTEPNLSFGPAGPVWLLLQLPMAAMHRCISDLYSRVIDPACVRWCLSDSACPVAPLSLCESERDANHGAASPPNEFVRRRPS